MIFFLTKNNNPLNAFDRFLFKETKLQQQNTYYKLIKENINKLCRGMGIK